MSNFNANNSGDGENSVFSAPNMSISDPISPSDSGGTESVTGPAPAAPAYDAAVIGAALLSHEDDGVDIHTTLEEARPLQSTSTPPSGKSPPSSSTMFQYRHPSLPALYTEDDTSGQHHPPGAGQVFLPNLNIRISSLHQLDIINTKVHDIIR